VSGIVFSPDGRSLAIGAQVGEVQVWRWQQADLVAEACTRLARNLFEDEWRLYMGAEPYRKICPQRP